MHENNKAMRQIVSGKTKSLFCKVSVVGTLTLKHLRLRTRLGSQPVPSLVQ